MRRTGLACLLAAAVLQGGCALPDPDTVLVAAPESCEDIVADGIASTPGQARWIAREGVRQQFADVRGNLLGEGFTRIRIVSRKVRCRPHSLGLGLTTCTALARACGR